jgi:hypothetical protein
MRLIKIVFFIATTILSLGSNFSDGGYREAASLFPIEEGMFQIGETMEYRVSYTFITLGVIRTRVTGFTDQGGKKIYRADVSMDSAPGLPFVTMHIKFYSEIDQDMFSQSFMMEDLSDGKLRVEKYSYDYDKKTATVAKLEKDQSGKLIEVGQQIFPISGKVQDGLSLLFFARQFFRNAGPVKTPVFIAGAEGATEFNFKSEITDLSIDAVDYPVEVNYFEGMAKFVGIFGMTGGFRGWFSNDQAGVPIVGRLNVLIGSAKVELVKWKRDGWNPPRYKD